MTKVNSNPDVSDIKQTLDQAEDGSYALPVRIVQTNATGSVNKNPTVGRLEQTLSQAEDGSMALPVEIVKLSEDGTTFIRSSDFGGGGGGEFDGTIPWESVTNKPSAFTPVEHNHDNRYYTKEQIDEPSFFQDRIDNITLALSGRELTVKSVDGLEIGVVDINDWLSGTTGNIQTQIDGINDNLLALTAGMRYLGKLETYADLQAVGNKENGNLAVVLADESRSGGRSMYVYSESIGAWEFIGEFTFTDAFLALNDTPTSYAGSEGKVVKVAGDRLVFGDVDYGDLVNKPASTITRIDNAVDKAHEHSNKSALDRFGINAEGVPTVDGVPYVPTSETKQRLFAHRTGGSQTLTVGENCVFNTKLHGNIPYNTSTGIFTLEEGRTYRVMVEGSILTEGYVILTLINTETGLRVNGAATGIWTLATKHREASAGPLKTYVTPTATRDYVIRATSVSGTSSLRTTYMTLEIKEV